MRLIELLETYEPDGALPDDVVAAFAARGEAQRDRPEFAMLAVQDAMYGGVISPVVEHIGDLTHRMTHLAGRGMFLCDIVGDKVRKGLRFLTDGYGFEREMEENIRASAKARDIDIAVVRRKLDVALRNYAAEHRKLTVYNRPQWLAREAAVMIGEKQFDIAIRHLQELAALCADVEAYNRAAASFQRGPDGGVLAYHPAALTESVWDDDADDVDPGVEPDEDAEPDWSHLPPSRIVRQLAPRLVAAAQAVYDRWDQSDPDLDDFNGGGICHLIADKMAEILGDADVPVGTVSSSHEQHVYCIGQFQDGVFEIGIHHSVYETGGGFSWKKLPGVTFEPTDVSIYRLSSDPAEIEQYVGEW